MSDNSSSPRRRHGLLSPFVWAGRSIARPLAMPEIRAQAGTIRDLYGVLRNCRAAGGPALLLDADRCFDLEASAQSLRLQAAEALDQGRITMEHYAQLGGVQAEELSILLQRRRFETARAAHLNLTFAILLIIVWVWTECRLPGGSPGLLFTLSMLSLCLLFLARAISEALMNWQIRTGRMGSLQEFLATDEPWRPS